MNDNIKTFDLVKIGNVSNIDFKDNKILVNLYYNLDIDDIKFIFLDLYNDFVPFKILRIEDNINKLYFYIKDIDLLKDFKTVRFKIYIEKDKYNQYIEEDKDVNIINFDVFDINDIYCGKVSNVFDYPNNKCIEVCEDNVKKLIPFINNFVKVIDIKNSKIIISSNEDLT